MCEVIGLFLYQATLYKQYCHRVACKRGKRTAGQEGEGWRPPGLVEQSRLGIGKIPFGLMTHPSSSYPR